MTQAGVPVRPREPEVAASGARTGTSSAGYTSQTVEPQSAREGGLLRVTRVPRPSPAGSGEERERTDSLQAKSSDGGRPSARDLRGGTRPQMPRPSCPAVDTEEGRAACSMRTSQQTAPPSPVPTGALTAGVGTPAAGAPRPGIGMAPRLHVLLGKRGRGYLSVRERNLRAPPTSCSVRPAEEESMSVASDASGHRLPKSLSRNSASLPNGRCKEGGRQSPFCRGSSWPRNDLCH